jgi:hypothetical protein
VTDYLAISILHIIFIEINLILKNKESWKQLKDEIEIKRQIKRQIKRKKYSIFFNELTKENNKR